MNLLRILLVSWLLPAIAAADVLDDHERRLRRSYAAGDLAAADGPRFTVRADRDGDTTRAETYFLLRGAGFDDLVQTLVRPRNWCQTMLLHLNVKGCVSQGGDPPRVRLFLGRKYYEEPAEAVTVDFEFSHAVGKRILQVLLRADEGPYGTSRYRFALRAVPVAEGAFVELRLATDEGYAGRLLDVYLNTLGRSKVGFTREGTSFFGNPQFVRGQLGAAERNVVRYMFALQVTLQHAEESFLDRAARWFDATEKYPRQLHELERESYLSIKARELENQQALQAALDRGEAPSLLERLKER